MSDLLFFKDDALIYKAKSRPWKAPKVAKFQDAFEMKYSSVATTEMTDAELGAAEKGSVMFFDTEFYSNFFYATFRHIDTGKHVSFELSDGVTLNLGKLQWVMQQFCIVGYNSNKYDVLMLLCVLKGMNNQQLFKASCEIIQTNIQPYQFIKNHKLKEIKLDHIDLIEVAPLVGSLKLYAGRLHTARMQDLPFDPMLPLSKSDMMQLREYCGNDVSNTELLFRELREQLLLRVQMSQQYGVDLRSKSDAQVAEAVISSELHKLSGEKPQRANISPHSVYRYNVPSFISYRSPQLREMLEVIRNAEFRLDGNGYIEMPHEIAALSLKLGICTYKMGIGGLHSTEKTVGYQADDDTLLIDRDVVSYYPSIVLNQGLYPKHLGKVFLQVYKTIVDRRITAKERAAEIEDLLKPLEKITNANPVERELLKKLKVELTVCKVIADSLKITINGSFGKLGSKWSCLYAPDLMIQVTLTGQLALLMLIEMIEDLGIPVVSANTDGVVIKCPKSRYAELQARIAWWESLTAFKTEETRYKAIYSRDVNNYIAHKEDGKCKVKGTYSERGSAGNSVLSKNPENLICSDAVTALIAKGTPIEETIRGCKDIRRFVTIRNVTGGARKSNAYLGKVIRWYYSTQMKGEINRATKGDKVPNSDGARPLMEIPAAFPVDVDYARYIEAARKMLFDIGYEKGRYKALTGDFGPLFYEEDEAA